MSAIVLASTNLGKIKEFQEFFLPLNIKICLQSEFNVPPIDEPYPSFIENALHKARHTAKYVNLPVLADDSGLCVEAINNQPGIYSARYAGSPSNAERNNLKLLEELSGKTNRAAYFYCVLVLIKDAIDPRPIIAEGILAGEITQAPLGCNGHGYDPVFWLPNVQKTLAECSLSEKNQISHRALAIQDLIIKLRGGVVAE